MATVVLNAISAAFPLITNRMQATVSKASSPMAPVAFDIKLAPHPIRTWNFPGLPRDNYVFSLDEIDAGGAVVSNKAYFSVVPGEHEGELQRDDEQIQVGITPGFVAGATTATFDGTAGKPDYRGWEIVPSELTGRGILVEGVDYSWNSATGLLSLLISGNSFSNQQYWNIHFNCIEDTTGTSVPVPSLTDFVFQLITADITLTNSSIGKKIICEPAGEMITVTLPLLSTVAAGRKTMIEVSNTVNMCTAKFVPQGVDTMNYVFQSIIAIPNESFSIYKYERSVGVYEWRLCELDGNFKTFGGLVGSDVEETDAINMKLLNGTSESRYKYSRIYEQLVLQLPIGTQVVNYDDWLTGNNQYKFSYANSANPVNAGKFRFPNRRGLTDKNNNGGVPGNYEPANIGYHQHEGTTGELPSSIFGKGIPTRTTGSYFGTRSGKTDMVGPPVDIAGNEISVSTENRVASVLTNKYILL